MNTSPLKYERVSNVAGLVWILLLTMPFVVWGGIGVLSRFSNDIRQWLPKGFVEAEQYDWFIKHFGVDEMVVVSWEDCNLNDPRLPKLAEALRQQRDVGGKPVFSQVLTGPEILSKVVGASVSEEEAIQRCTGVFLGPDRQTTCLLAFPGETASKNRTKVVQLLNAVAGEAIGLKPDEMHLGGPTVDGATIDQESKRSLQTYIGLTALVVLGLTWFRLRNVLLTSVILGVAGYCGLIALTLLYWTGGSMNLTMIMLPTLAFILAVSGCVHMTNYYLKARYVHKTAEPIKEAVQYGAVPVLLSSLTTALGLASLATSQIVPIKLFGLYSAAAVMLALPLIVWLVPTILHMIAEWRPLIHGKRELEDESEQPLSPFLRACAWSGRIAPSFVSLLFVAGMLAVGWGCMQLQSTVKIQGRFAESTKIIKDYRWLEEKLGPLVPMEVILRVPKEHPLSDYDRMLVLANLDVAIHEDKNVTASYSAATFRPEMARGRGVRNDMEKRLMREAWESSVPQFVDGGLVGYTEEDQLWRISLRIGAMNDVDYGYLLDSIKNVVSAKVEKINTALKDRGQPANFDFVITGGVPMIYRAQHQVLSDLMSSFLWAFATISLVMMWVARGFWAGLISMLPNVLPPIIIFGIMGWTGWLIDIGSVMTASVAMGIAVDDTIHFLAWYRRGLERGLTRYGAVEFAFHHCGKSMIDSTLICGLGVAPFLFSEFLPTVRFSALMCLMLLVGLIGDLVFLPALLLSPLGRLFLVRLKHDPHVGHDQPEFGNHKAA